MTFHFALAPLSFHVSLAVLLIYLALMSTSSHFKHQCGIGGNGSFYSPASSPTPLLTQQAAATGRVRVPSVSGAHAMRSAWKL